MNEKVMILLHYLRHKFRSYPTERGQFERWQEEQVINHIQYVREHSEFYRQQWKTFTNEEWHDFPIIDKEMMMDHFDTLNTLGITKQEAFAVAERAEQSRDFSPMIGKTTVGLSSGTSGNRGIFLVSEKERREWTGAILAKALPQSIFRRVKIAFFLRANSNLYNSVKSRQIEFVFYDLLDSIHEHIEKLNNQQPGIIVAPPSMLRILAEAKQDKKLQINPQKIISVAEVLDPIDQRLIEQQFEQTIHQIYQCTEGFLANTCSHGTLHLNEDLVMFQKEYIDRELRKFMPIITDFSRKAQPIVRYRLNDVLTERATPCPCGSPLTALEAINGRSDDIFYFKSIHKDELRQIFPDFISRSIINASPKITEYYVIQYATDLIEVSYLLNEQYSASTIEQVEKNITEAFVHLCQKTESQLPTIQFRQMEEGIAMGYSASKDIEDVKKLRRIERRYEIHGTN